MKIKEDRRLLAYGKLAEITPAGIRFISVFNEKGNACVPQQITIRLEDLVGYPKKIANPESLAYGLYVITQGKDRGKYEIIYHRNINLSKEETQKEENRLARAFA